MGRKNLALQTALETFEHYESLHLAKDPPDHEKALANRNMAELLRLALRIPGDFAIGSDVWPGLGKIVEEMSENGVNFGKLIGLGGDQGDIHWDGRNLPKEMELELGDLLGAIDFFMQVNRDKLNVAAILNRRNEKSALFQKWQTRPALSPMSTAAKEEVEGRPDYSIVSLARSEENGWKITALWSDGYENSLDLRNYAGETEELIRGRLQQLRAQGQTTA